MAKVSCIIAAYNEKDRIKEVLDIVCKHPLIDEIIAVDDGSIDNTKEVFSSFPNLKFFIHTQNKGKSFAVRTGLREATGKFIVLIDADLVGLTEKNISDLINPVLENRADITISLRKNAPLFWRLLELDYISGERAFRKTMLENEYENLAKIPGFGLEVFMNKIILKNKLRIKIVKWPNVYSPEKYVKHKFKDGVRDEIGMFADIFKTVSFWGAVGEVISMLKLKIK